MASAWSADAARLPGAVSEGQGYYWSYELKIRALDDVGAALNALAGQARGQHPTARGMTGTHRLGLAAGIDTQLPATMRCQSERMADLHGGQLQQFGAGHGGSHQADMADR